MAVFIEHLLIKNFQENSLIFVYQVSPPHMGKGPFIPNQKNSANKVVFIKNFHLIMIINVTCDGTDYLGSV